MHFISYSILFFSLLFFPAVSSAVDEDTDKWTPRDEDLRILQMQVETYKLEDVLPGVNCGACGYKTCAELNKAEEVESLTANGPSCMFKNLNLGIAAGVFLYERMRSTLLAQGDQADG